MRCGSRVAWLKPSKSTAHCDAKAAGRRQRSASSSVSAATAGLARTAAKLARTAASVSSSDAVDTTA